MDGQDQWHEHAMQETYSCNHFDWHWKYSQDLFWNRRLHEHNSAQLYLCSFQKSWPELFKECMIELMSIEGEVFLQNLIVNDKANNANDNNNHLNGLNFDEEEEEDDDSSVMSF